jgi:hypothetical protein
MTPSHPLIGKKKSAKRINDHFGKLVLNIYFYPNDYKKKQLLING